MYGFIFLVSEDESTSLRKQIRTCKRSRRNFETFLLHVDDGEIDMVLIVTNVFTIIHYQLMERYTEHLI